MSDIQIPEHWKAEIIERAAMDLRHRAMEDFGAIATEVIRSALDDAIRERAAQMLEPVVADMIESGFPVTNTYGEATGKTVSLKDRIAHIIFSEDSYRGNMVQQLVTEHLKKNLDQHAKEEVEKARKALRTLVDEEVFGRVRDAIRSALKA